MRVRFFALFLIALTLICAAPPARAQAIPPDVQAILDKLKRREQPTPEDMARIQQWQADMRSGVTRQHGLPAAPPPTSVTEVPVRIDVKINFISKNSAGNGSDTCQITGWMSGFLRVQGSGDGNWKKSMVDPRVHAAAYNFGPPLDSSPDAMRGTSGGSYTYDSVGEKSKVNTSGTFVYFRVAANFVTTGRGDGLLYPASGDANGLVHGKRSSNGVVGAADGTVNYDEQVGTDPHQLFCFEADHPLSSDDPVPAPHGGISQRALDEALASGETRTFTVSEPIDQSEAEGRLTMTGTASFKVTIRPTKVQLLIEPADEADYEKWLPVPTDQREIFGRGETLTVRARLVKQPGSNEPPPEGGRIDFSITEASDLPGTCTNYPIDAPSGPDAPKDLIFSKTQPAGIVRDDDEHVHTSDAVKDAIAVLEATDTGAYGKVQAAASLTGVSLTSFCVRTSEPELAIPLDDNQNHVADCWEQSFKIGKDKPATWDEEPQNGQRDTGDGLTLFEEYRGFVFLENHDLDTYKKGIYKHVRTSPMEKDVFCYDPDLIVLQYEFPENPQAVTWHFLDPTTMRWTGDRMSPDHRWVNPNTPHDLGYARQYALHFYYLDIQESDTMPEVNPATGKPTGKTVPRVVDTGGFDAAGNTVFLPGMPADRASSTRFACCTQINRAAGRFAYRGFLNCPRFPACWQGDQGLQLYSECVRADLKLTVMHEVGHWFGIRHHGGLTGPEPTWHFGSDSCVMRYANQHDYDGVAGGHLDGIKPRMFCRVGAIAHDKDGNSVDSDDCWSQITVKNQTH